MSNNGDQVGLSQLSRKWAQLSAMPAQTLVGIEEVHLAHLVLERYWNDGSPSGHGLGMPHAWAPSNPEFGFSVPVAALAADSVTVVEDVSVGSGLTVRVEPSDEQPFPLHPAMLEHLRASRSVATRDHIIVVPTSSGRTVAVTDLASENISFLLKLAYPRPLGRFNRDLSLYKWLSSLERSQLLREAHSASSSWSMFPEDSGGYAEMESRRHGVGFLARRLPALPLNRTLLIPAFSLWAKPFVGRETVLSAIVRRTGWSYSETVELLIFRLLDSYFSLALHHGLMPELNAQNVVYVLKPDGDCFPCFRDMQDVFVDDVVREQRGLSTGGVSYKRLNAQSTDLHQRRSFSYDFKLGEYILSPLVDAISDSFSAAEKLNRKIKETARRWVESETDYWPSDDTWFCYPPARTVGRTSYEVRRGCKWR